MNRLGEDAQAFVDAVVGSGSPRRLVIAGPGTGKTSLFRRVLESEGSGRDRRLILTFINNLADELERELGHLSHVYTFHAYCHLLLRRHREIRRSLREGFRYFPKLVHLIKVDWETTKGSEAPQFVALMRNLERGPLIDFYTERGDYYQAISYDDSVFRVYESLVADPDRVPMYELVLVDEYQDFNRLEVSLIELLATRNRVLVAGDDDQALYSQLKGSDPRFIRELCRRGDYEILPLPYCMRCTEVIVGAVNDVVQKAIAAGSLPEHIEKPYRYYPSAKQTDSLRYPKIRLVETTIQRLDGGNYFGRYVEEQIEQIPAEEIQQSRQEGFPTVLVIAADPYRWQVVHHLRLHGYTVDTADKEEPSELARADGLKILQEDPESNLGWRIMLETDRPAETEGLIAGWVQEATELAGVVPREFREAVQREAEAWREEPIVAPELSPEDVGRPSIRATSFEGAKGLSAQHVFITGLHNGELPRNPKNIHDLEICKFIVALTRARKQCHIIYTRRFGNAFRRPSVFISWLDRGRLLKLRVDKRYWRAPF